VIQCSNPTCRAANQLPVSRCQTCKTPLLYRFLLADSAFPLQISPGTIVADRYQVWQHPIWLDLQPEVPLTPLYEVPACALPYLRLAELAQHLPRPYTYLSALVSGLPHPVLLLEGAALGVVDQADGTLQCVALPSLGEAWGQGTPLQQLNWLRQIAHLWPHLREQRVAETLLQIDCLRVDQALLRLAHLNVDGESSDPPSLARLGQVWQPLAKIAHPTVTPYLSWLALALGQGTITSPTALLAELERAIQTLAQGLTVTIDWAAATDQGPSRDRNEDACYPQEPAALRVLSRSDINPSPAPLIMVCDGIGGHEQGNIASQTAIQVLRDSLESLTQPGDLAPGAIADKIHTAILKANNVITQRNNEEQRSSRARMGTTLVLALVHSPYLFVAHVGDSRAYRLSGRTGYQITMDDDIASRESQQGYTFQPEAAQLPSGGALVQALGINDAHYLYPTIQYLLLDDPSVLLLCSDGLSDYDRVNLLWRSAVQAWPHQSLAAIGQTLIQQANRLNGHDNVSVALMGLSPQPLPPTPLPAGPLIPAAEPSSPVSLPVSERPQSRISWPVWAGVGVATTALLGGMGALGWQQYHNNLEALPWPAPLVITSNGIRGEPLFQLAQEVVVRVPLGSLWQVRATPPPGLGLTASPGPAQFPGVTPDPIIPAGSVVRVVRVQTQADQSRWLALQICSIPAGADLDQAPRETDSPVAIAPPSVDLKQRLIQPGQRGWVRAYHLYQRADLLDSATATQVGNCLSGL
jgi:serine/threonine protein phosphatase PrpC